MTRPAYPRSIFEFQERFATEDSCREYLIASRWPDGFRCPGCGGDRAGGETRRHVWVCTACGRQTSVTAGTVMHGTRVPLRLWFWAAYLVATHQPGISAKQLQRQLGLSRYETAWLIMQKLRRAMAAPERRLLSEEIEIDEFYVGGQRGEAQERPSARQEGAMRARDRGQGPRLGAAAPRRPARCLRTSPAAFTKATTVPGAIVHTDELQSHIVLAKHGYDHRRRPQDSAKSGEQLLPRAHRSISNLKSWIDGTHRGVSDKHLQVYLDEYVFRHNRRVTPMAAFQTLLRLSSAHKPTTYAQITRATAA